MWDKTSTYASPRENVKHALLIRWAHILFWTLSRNSCSLRQPSGSACEATGNRRLVHCIPMSLYKSLDHDQFLHRPVEGGSNTWEPCGKIVSAERADYWEFVLCNVVFATVCLFIVFTRTRRIAAVHYKNLVARIRGRVRVGWT